MIVNTTRIQISPENRKELFQTILPLLDPIRNEQGCLAYRCYVDFTDENSAVLIGEWETQADVENHLRSRDSAILFGAINLLTRPASVDFKLLSCISGVENMPSVLALTKEE